MMKKIIVLLTLLFTMTSLSATAASPYDISQENRISALIEELQATSRTPSVVVQVTAYEQGRPQAKAMVSKRYYGTLDFTTKRKPNNKTLYNIASVSKLFTGTMIAMLIDENKLTLDKDINQILLDAKYDWQIGYPANESITLKHLVTHTSGIVDSVNDKNRYFLCSSYYIDNKRGNAKRSFYNWYFNQDYCGEFNSLAENHKLKFSSFMREYFSAEGILFQPAHFQFKSGTVMEYSNIGVALAGLVAEAAVNTSFDKLIRHDILRPLQMNNTNLVPKHHAKRKKRAYGHTFREADNAHIKLPLYYDITWPEGGVVTNLDDLAKFINAVMVSYHNIDTGKQHLLSPALAKKMISPMFVDDGGDGIGILWATEQIPSALGKKRVTIGHSGEQHGYSSYAFFLKDKQISVILLANGQLDKNNEEKFMKLIDLLFAHGEAMIETKK